MNGTSQKQQKPQKYKSQQFITKVIFNIGISSILIGYSNVCFSSIDYQQFVKVLEIQQNKQFYQGMLTGAVSLAACLGGIMSSFILKKFSRTHSFLVVNFFYVFIIIGLMIKNVHTMILFRLLQGCTTGIYSTLVPIYIKQFSPLQLSSKMGTYFQMLIVFGLGFTFFFSYILSLFFTAQFFWRIIFVFPIFLISFQSYTLIYKYNYQTPKYLLSIQKYKQAKQVLNVIYKQQYVQQRLQQLKKMFAVCSNKNIQLVEITNSGINNDNNISTKKKEIKYHNNWIAIYAAIHITSLQPLTGISVVIGYGAEIVKVVAPSLSKILPIFLHWQAVIACFFTIQLLKTRGRKQIIQYGIFGCGICTFTLGYYIAQFHSLQDSISPLIGFVVIFAMFAYRFVYGVTIGAVAFLYMAQIVEPNVQPVINFLYWIIGGMAMIIFPIIRKNIFDGNPGPIFICLSIYSFLSIIINHYILVETKGKKQYQIRLQFDKILGIKHLQQQKNLLQ